MKRLQHLPVFCALGLALHAVSASAADPEWIRRCEISNSAGNAFFALRWDPGPGLGLRIEETGSGRSLTVWLKPDGGEVRVSGADIPQGVKSGTRFFPSALPREAMASVAATLTFRQEWWGLYLDDRLVAQVPCPFMPPAALLTSAANLPPEDALETDFQKVADFRFTDNFLVPPGEENQLAQWDLLAGAWFLHSAASNVLEDADSNAPRNRQLPEFERSPNFYSLKGAGTNALMVSGYDFYDAYTFEASVEVLPGEMGLVFYRTESGRYVSFTARAADPNSPVYLVLTQVDPGEEPQRRILEAVRTETLPGQWVKLKVRVLPDRVQCFMDDLAVMDAPVALPSGGRFGLFVNRAEGCRFDDVKAQTCHDLDLRDEQAVRRHTWMADRGFFGRGGLAGRLGLRRHDGLLNAAPARPARRLVLGSAGHDPHVFSAVFRPAGAGEVGLLAGYKGPGSPWFEFTRREQDGRETFTLRRVETNTAALVEQIELPPPANKGEPRVSLMADASNPGELRLYRDGKLVLIAHAGRDALAGASGLFLGPGAGALIERMDYTFERDMLYRNQFEKNRYFVSDPFMRHWSSPEGEWLTETNGLTWYKSDLLGRFVIHLPIVPNSSLQLGVAEGGTNGAFMVAVEGTNLVVCADGAALPPDGTNAPGPLTLFTAPVESLPIDPQVTNRTYALHSEGYWFWLTAGERLLFKRQLERPLAGTRVRIAGFREADLHQSYVERFGLKDFLFTEAPHAWTANGGRWSVVNRFQCQPRWSNMNGESAETLAALWAKFVFRGDFCAEMYAGIRHGSWYQRCGDLNLTVMNKDTTPSQGYSVTCTGWDPDHSQLYTRLYRNGEVVATSDRYLVPRTREGNVRKGYEPLVADGRPVHGAWYYIKLRRVGGRVEYYFDNERILAFDDDAPINGGGLGIWTFMNSMVVARVKIAAEDIRPRPFAFERVRPDDPALAAALAPPPPPAPAPPSPLLIDGLAASAMQAEDWTLDDPVGRATLAWSAPPAPAAPFFSVRNRLGSGAMPAACGLPARPYRDVAGWQFQVRRTPRAQFNFHYAVGVVGTNGVFTPCARFFHRLSGTDFDSDAMRLTGETALPAATAGADLGQPGDAGWTPVTVWALAPGVGQPGDSLCIRAEGFGTLQPSFVLQGLTGNGPGEGYAVRDFTAIRYGAPVFSAAGDATGLIARVTSGTARPAAPCDPAALTRWAAGLGPGRHAAALEPGGSDPARRVPVAWITLPEAPAVTCDWSATKPAAIEFTCAADYPDRRFLYGSPLTIGGATVAAETDRMSRRTAHLPLDPALARPATNAVPAGLHIGDRTLSFNLPWAACPLNAPPVLRSLGPAPAVFLNFEDPNPAPLAYDPARMRVRRFDPAQGAYLEVSNRGNPQRLRASLQKTVNTARHPICQFRYRATGMVNVQLHLGDAGSAFVSEPGARKVREAGELVRDGQWHTWRGIISDAAPGGALTLRPFTAGALQLGSFGGTDQTGLFTTWDLDDIVVGPAVEAVDKLTLTPLYFDFDGDCRVQMAVRQGGLAFDELSDEARAALAWRDVPNGAPARPDPAGLTAGPCQVFLRATDGGGAVSAVTSVPFLLDPRTDTLRHAFVKNEHPIGNESRLDITVRTEGGAALDPEGLTLYWDETAVALDTAGSMFVHTPQADTLQLNWPLIFRHPLDAASDGETHRIVLKGLRDGAGRALPDVVAEKKLELAADKTPPTLLGAAFPSNLLWRTDWERATQDATLFKANHGCPLKLVREAGEEPFLRMHCVKERGEMFVETGEKEGWPLNRFPWLALRVRRPDYSTNDQSRVSLVLAGDGDKTYIIPLTEGGPRNRRSGRRVTILPGAVEWQTREWKDVIVNVADLVRTSVEEQQLEKQMQAKNADTTKAGDEAAREADRQLAALRIRQLRLTVAGSTEKTLIDVQNVAILDAWGTNGVVTLDAFDASGMRGLAWSRPGTDLSGEAATPALAPGAEPIGNGTAGWLLLRPRDKAGNTGPVVRLPLLGDEPVKPEPPAAPPPPPAAPPEIKPEPTPEPAAGTALPQPQPGG